MHLEKKNLPTVEKIIDETGKCLNFYRIVTYMICFHSFDYSRTASFQSSFVLFDSGGKKEISKHQIFLVNVKLSALDAG